MFCFFIVEYLICTYQGHFVAVAPISEIDTARHGLVKGAMKGRLHFIENDENKQVIRNWPFTASQIPKRVR